MCMSVFSDFKYCLFVCIGHFMHFMCVYVCFYVCNVCLFVCDSHGTVLCVFYVFLTGFRLSCTVYVIFSSKIF